MLKSMAVSIIITTLNEEKSILPLLKCLKNQTYKAKEIITVDASSTDQTVKLIKNFSQQYPKLQLKIFVNKNCSRSQGRNLAIKQVQSPLIAITDAGCLPHPDWLEKMLEKFIDFQAKLLTQQRQKNQKQNQEQNYSTKNLPVVAGYYWSLAKTPFQAAMIPFVLVMADRLNKNFLPSTRSMLLAKTTWKKIGGFREDLNYSEDYEFALRLKKNHVPIIVAQNALVNWQPRTNLLEFFMMIYNFAQGDIKAGIFRYKVILVFLRYFFGLMILAFIPHYYFLTVMIMLMLYSLWAIQKNQRYVNKGWFYLPILQITADLAVMWGTLEGIFNKLLWVVIRKN